MKVEKKPSNFALKLFSADHTIYRMFNLGYFREIAEISNTLLWV